MVTVSSNFFPYTILSSDNVQRQVPERRAPGYHEHARGTQSFDRHLLQSREERGLGLLRAIAGAGFFGEPTQVQEFHHGRVLRDLLLARPLEQSSNRPLQAVTQVVTV